MSARETVVESTKQAGSAIAYLWKIRPVRWILIALSLCLVCIQFLISSQHSRLVAHRTEVTTNSSIGKEIAERVEKSFSRVPGPEVAGHLLKEITELNPVIRAYLLNKHGVIIATPDRKLTRQPWIEKATLRKLLALQTGTDLPLGIDPLESGDKQYPVSVAEVRFSRDKESGYIYAVIHPTALAGSFGTFGYTLIMIALMFLVVITLSLIFGWYLRDREAEIDGLSHDLRGPLASIEGYVETLQQQGDKLSPQEREKFLNVALKSTRSLSSMVTDVFDIARLSDGSAKLAHEPISLSELMGDLLQRMKGKAQERRLNFTYQIPQTPLWTLGTASFFERALANIVENAIKYTPRYGSVNVALFVEGDSLKILVTDTGIGMKQDEVKRVGEKFFRSQASQRFAKGTGIGLALTKKIIELHSGVISIQSNEGAGTTVAIMIPQLIMKPIQRKESQHESV